MDAVTLKIVLAVLQNGPEAINFAVHTGEMLAGGRISEEDLVKLWQNAGTAFLNSRARWSAAPAPQA